MDNRITQALQRYHDRVSLSREVMFTALYGSQNYGLDTPESDVDAYSVTVPSRHELIFGRPSGEDPVKSTPSSAYCYDTGKITVKDIRQMMDAYVKQAINFCETLFTPHIIINPRYATEVAELRAHAEKIASADLYQQLRTTEGMLQSQMVKTHAPTTPTIADSPTRMKCLARAMHCWQFIQRRSKGATFADALVENEEWTEWFALMRALKNDTWDADAMTPIASTLAEDAKAFWEGYKLEHDPDEHRKARAELRNELADIACSAITKNIGHRDGKAVE